MAASVFGVLSMPVGNLAAKQAIKAAGCTHTVIQAQWSALQPSGPGTALSAAAVASLQQELADAKTAGLKVMWENALHYPPAWVLPNVELFKDQNSATWNAAGQSSGSGQQVVNWMWTSAGQGYVSDFLNKLGAALTTTQLAQIVEMKTGGGWYGEVHYAPPAGSGNSWYGFGTSQQTGTGLATNQTVCPLPGYIPFSGGSGETTADDIIWVNWYLNGLVNWVTWFIAAQRSAGFTYCDYHVCHSGYGVRSNYTITQASYQQSAALGEDPVRLMGAYWKDPRVWPYCTWLDTSDGYDPSSVDSDVSAWKKIYAEAVKRNKHFRLWGENTGGETASQMAAIFSGGTYGSALSTSTYNVAPPQGTFGYTGLFWLSYATLIAGGSNASLANYATNI